MQKLHFSLFKLRLSNMPLNIAFVIILLVLILSGSRLPGKYFTIKIGATSHNFSNKWHYKFYYLDGTVIGRFSAINDTAKLIYSGNIESGKIVFHLFGADGLVCIIPVRNTSDTLKDKFKKGGNYTIRATATKSRGSFDFKME
jgi:hypothetical protein